MTEQVNVVFASSYNHIKITAKLQKNIIQNHLKFSRTEPYNLGFKDTTSRLVGEVETENGLVSQCGR